MKLLFVENRYKTFTFEKIGEFLQKEGHEIAFIIQNKNYNVNNSFKKYIIPYPKNKEKIIYDRCDGVERIISCDRMQNFFKKKGVEYFYYYDNEIKNILNDFKPDFVFGESTAFHELLVINNCKKNCKD